MDVLALAQFTDEARDAALARARRDPALERLVVVSTCNRVELYTASATLNAETAQRVLSEYLTRGDDQLAEALAPHLRFAAGDAAVRHLFHVAAGLDSLVLGEQQILAQISAALGAANAAHAVSPMIKRTFKAAVEAGHRARTDAWQAAGATSISAVAADAAFEACVAHSGDGTATDAHVAVIGAGMMARLAVKALRARGVGRITIANRTVARAESLAARYEARGVGLTELSSVLRDAHAIVVAAAAPTVLVTAVTIAAARAAGNSDADQEAASPLTIVDIGMPRMVETSVRALPGVTLVDLDTIRSHIDRAVSGRHQVLADAEGVIDQAVHAFLAEQHPEIPLAIPRPRRGTVAQDGMQETVEHTERRSTTATPSSKAS